MLEGNKTMLGLNDYLAGQLRRYMRDNRDLDDFTRFEQKIKALTPESVNAALRKYFDKSKLVMIYGGDFEKDKKGKPVEKKGF
jgi:zinc protease